LSDKIDRHHTKVTIGFIIFSTIVFILIGKPIVLLILAGAFNGLVLPLALGAILVAAHNKSIVGDYKHPIWLSIFGWIVFLGTAYLAAVTLKDQISQLFS
jgi:Mn2+/Fe2+ NRAMP family transporter